MQYTCNCATVSQTRHTLPKGCVMDSILRAQKLDSLDSANAVQLYDKLCDQYDELKCSYYPPYTTMIESFANEQYCKFIEKFINDNLDNLEKVSLHIC